MKIIVIKIIIVTFLILNLKFVLRANCNLREYFWF